jgi:hypothetical protein
MAQGAHHVVPGAVAPIGHHPGGILAVTHKGVGRLSFAVGVPHQRAEHVVAPGQELIPILGLDAEVVGDHDQRQPGRNIPHEVTLAPLADLVDDLVADPSQVRFAITDPGRGVAPVDEPATGPVLRIVHVDHHRCRSRFGADAAGARERRWVLRNPPHVLVSGNAPHRAVPVHGRVLAHPPELLVGVVAPELPAHELDILAGGVLSHSLHPLFGPGASGATLGRTPVVSFSYGLPHQAEE